MKSIKRNFQGVRFSDVLLSALSISFQNYFESKGDHIPNTMTVVVPARIEAEGNLNKRIQSTRTKRKLGHCSDFFSSFSLFYCRYWYAIGAQLKLQNKFSVGLQTLPIRGKKSAKNQASRFHSKMLEVKKYSDLLRNSPDYYVNSPILPNQIVLLVFLYHF